MKSLRYLPTYHAKCQVHVFDVEPKTVANKDLQPIWDFFKTTKEVDAHRSKLMDEMATWVKKNEVTINRGLYFDKAAMGDIVKLDFTPGTAIQHLP
jgi:hypothetical protein